MVYWPFFTLYVNLNDTRVLRTNFIFQIQYTQHAMLCSYLYHIRSMVLQGYLILKHDTSSTPFHILYNMLHQRALAVRTCSFIYIHVCRCSRVGDPTRYIQYFYINGYERPIFPYDDGMVSGLSVEKVCWVLWPCSPEI